eukprot:4937044-Prymnesium_polylepis.1
MGLGKTVEMCALILANPYTARASAAGRAAVAKGTARPMPTKATLVVVPVVLLQQWASEIAKCAGGALRTHVYHGDVVSRHGGVDVGPFAEADIVLTTYEVLRQEAAMAWMQRALLRMHWWRVVLDECAHAPARSPRRARKHAHARTRRGTHDHARARRASAMRARECGCPGFRAARVGDQVRRARARLLTPAPHRPTSFMAAQRMPKPAGAASAMTAIAKACAELSRTHSWCMSGTPAGSVVDDLLGQ